MLAWRNFGQGLRSREIPSTAKDFWGQFAVQFLAWHLHDPTKFYAYQGKVIR